MLSNPEGRLRPEPTATPASFGFRDGLGERRRRDDASGGAEILCIRQELAVVPSFEFALRERASRLASFHHPSFARVRAIERALEPQQQLLVVSDLAPGTRLSALLANADSKGAVDTNAALCLLRQLVGAVAALHETARDAAHGAIAPERLVVTANGRLVIVEYVLGSALEQLLLSRERYWSELRVALPRMAGLPRFDHLTDVTQVGSVGLALLLGRTLKDEESPTRIADVLGSVKAVSPRGTEPLQAPLRAWLERALQLDPRQSFPSAIEARASLDKAIAESGFDASQTSLDGFLARVNGTERPASGPAPRSVQVPVAQASAPTPVPQQAAVATPRPMPIPQPAAASTPRPMPIPQPAAASTPRPMPIPSFAAAPTPRPAPIPAHLLTMQGLAESVTTQGLAESAAPHGLTDPWAAAKTPRPQPAVMFGSSVTETEIQEPASGGKGKWLAMAAVAAAIVVAVGTMGAKSFFKPAPAKPVTGKLSISTDPAGARVTIDGSARGATPLTVELSAGSHKVELHSASGTRSMPVVITAGTTSSQYVDLPKAASTVGQMRIRTEPAGARITLDGTPRGASPQLVSNLTPGEHTVQVDSDLGSVTQTVTVEAGSTASVLLTVAPSETPAATSGWISVSGKLHVQVFENGELLGTSETTKLMLATGKHDLELVSDAVGYRSARSVQVAAGKVSTLTVEPPTGSIALNALPWAEVWIDGEKVGETPIGNFTLPVGSHEVVFKHPELGEQKVTALVTLKEQARVSADLRKK